jgi:aspartokinase/homoserine dehydrogenase 1
VYTDILPGTRGDGPFQRRERTDRSAELTRCHGVRVLKFGGSSLATPERIRDVARIVLSTLNGTPVLVVVSAFQGVTNQLLDCARLAEQRDAAFELEFEQIAARHHSAIDGLLNGHQRCRLHALVDDQLAELRDALHGIRRLGVCPPAALDSAASFGERLSALVVSAYLNRFRRTRFVDARRFVTTDEQFTRANVNFAKTNRAAREFFATFWRRSRAVAVVTGFIGRTADGRTTTIGRNGSDYSAAIVAAALGASVIEIWTDVDGVLSADPKAVSSAFVLPQMTYEEARELSCFGAKVLHAGTIGPAVAKSIPIVVKNSFNPSAPGTLISRQQARFSRPARSVSSVGEVTLLTLRARRAIGADAAQRLFRALASQEVNVLLSQASADHTICFAVGQREADAAAQAVTREFRVELRRGLAKLDQKSDQAIVAVVGEGVKGRPEVAGAVLGALGRHKIGISAIAQGASGRNLSCVIDGSQQSRALNAVHRHLFEARRSLALAIVGVGNVGGALLRQLCERRAFLLAEGFDVQIVAVANSKRVVVRRDGLDLSRWRDDLEASNRPMDPRALAQEIAGLELANAALVDCTAASSIVDAYPAFVKANLHIVTPNKRANVLPWRRYVALKNLFAMHQKSFLYETNVGAGLPVISTLRHLIVNGDAINKVEGIFSGTLSYLFNTFDGTVPFSTLVRDAHRMGYTEPDPREDLTGQDVARKLLILARQTGLQMELDDVSVDSLVPRCLTDGPFSQAFFSTYAAHDAVMAERFERARARGAVLRFVGALEGGRARAEIREYPRDHPFATTRGTDNIIAFTTNRYAPTPLIVQGPGAGADVTAMGVFADILRLLDARP